MVAMKIQEKRKRKILLTTARRAFPQMRDGSDG